MIIDKPIEELLLDVNSVNLESSENVDDQHTVRAGNISLVDDKDYIFSEITSVAEPHPLSCVDGGNAPILNWGTLVIELNKVVNVDCPVQGESSRLGPFKFLSLTYTANENVNTKLYHTEAGLAFSPKQLEPKELRGQSQTYVLAGRARRVMELLFAAHIISIRRPRVLLLDGSLGHTFDRAEINALDTLLERALNSGVTLTALTKVSSILYRGEPITHHVNRLAKKQGLKHFYTMVGTAHRGGNRTVTQLYVVRLSSLAKKPYLLEVYNSGDADAVARLMYTLACNSNNIAIPGYPQGLALADRYARVTAEEANTVKTVLSKHREVPLISEALAHDLLDYW